MGIDTASSVVADITPGTDPTDLGKAEDQAHVSGDVGVEMLAVRTDTPANRSGTDGDYEPLQVSAGRLWCSTTVTAISAGTNIIGKAGIDQTTPGTTNAVAPISGQAGVAGGAGAVAATVQRMTLASDDPAVASLSVIDDWDSTDACKVVGVAALVQGTVAGATAIAAAGDYAANDILSDSTSAGVSWLFSNLARISGGSGIVTRAVVTCSVEAFAPRLRLWLFNTTPTTTSLNDNVAFSLDADDRTKVIGYLDFPAMADAGEVSYAQNVDVRLALKAVGSAHIYGVLQTLDAITNESAGMTITLELHILQD